MNGLYLLGLTYGGYGIMRGTLTYGTLTALLQLIGQILGLLQIYQAFCRGFTR